MNSVATAIDLLALIDEVEALLVTSPQESSAELDVLLTRIATGFREATVGSSAPANATELGARGFTAMMRLPVTLYSPAAAEALWEVARFSGIRRINRDAVAEMGRRLLDVGNLLGEAELRRKGHVLASAVNSQRANYGAAIEHAWAAMKVAKASGDHLGIASGWNNVAIALAGCGLNQAAMRCLEKMLANLDGANVAFGAVRQPGLNNLALTALYAGDFHRGLRAAEQAFNNEPDDVSVRAAASRILAGVYYVRLLLETGAAERARAICERLRTLADQVGSEAFAVEIELADGLCCVVEGNAVKGLEQIHHALEACRRLQVELRDALTVAIRAHEVAGDAATADRYRRELALHNRMVQQESMLAQHRMHLARLQSSDGTPAATLERKAEMVERLAITTELREDPTGLRVFRVGCLARLLATAVGWSDSDAEALEVAARLHDIGKISVSDEIVTKRGALTDTEVRAMQGHCVAGAELLRETQLENARLAADVAVYHHEAWDGSGYPHGIGGTAIPLAARIVAIADAFDAMTQDRPYRRAVGIEAALAQLQAGAGSRYDPALVTTFVSTVRRLQSTTDDLEGYLAEAADRSPFIRVHRQVAERLGETPWGAAPVGADFGAQIPSQNSNE